MRKTLVLSMLFAATAFVLFLSRPSPSQDLDAGPVDAELFDVEDGDEDAGVEDLDGEEELNGDDEDGGFSDLIDAGFDPFVDTGPDPIPLPEEDGEVGPPDSFTPPVLPELEPR